MNSIYEKYSVSDVIQPNLIPNLTSFKSGSKKVTQQTEYLNSKVLDISFKFLCKKEEIINISCLKESPRFWQVSWQTSRTLCSGRTSQKEKKMIIGTVTITNHKLEELHQETGWRWPISTGGWLLSLS